LAAYHQSFEQSHSVWGEGRCGTHPVMAAWPNVDDTVITAWRTPDLTGSARTRTRVCTKERRYALVALHRLLILALLVDA